LNDNTYDINLSKNFGINFTFNVEDPMNYRSPAFNSNNPLVDEPKIELVF